MSMKRHPLGLRGPIISEVGFGAMGISDFYASSARRDDEEGVATIQAALDAGINFINTGDFYGMGHNEMLVGRAIAGRRDEVVLSVKFGALRGPNGMFLGYDSRPAAVKNFAAYSLQRLGTDHIDIYQPARLDPATPIEETVGAIAQLIKEGKVKYLGLSEVNPDIIRRAHAVHPVTALEIEYSLATRFIEREILAVARELGIGIVAYGSLCRGLLTGKVNGKFERGDFRSVTPRYTGQNLQTNLILVATLVDIALFKGCTPSQLALAWVLSQGDDIFPLIGTSKRERLKENLGALDIRFSAADMALLDEAFPDGTFQGDRYPGPAMHSVAG
jgi:aryl-alcohol dehydrogenase-like predicted oxidoreductase